MLKQELIEFDRKELSERRLIELRYRGRWLMFLLLPFVCIAASFYWALILSSYFLKFICVILMPVFLYLAFMYGKRKTLIVLRMYSIRYQLGIDNIWEERNLVIRKLQLEKLRIFLSHRSNIDRDKIKFLIERLSNESNYPRYQYKFMQMFSTFFTIIAGGFLTAVIALPAMFKSWSNVIVFFKPIVGFALMITLFSWFFEEMLFKDIFKSSSRKYYRLIQTLENYYLKYC